MPASLDKPITADTPITAATIAAMTHRQREALVRYQRAKQQAFATLTRKCRAANRAAQRAESGVAYARAEGRYTAANSEYAAALAKARADYAAALDAEDALVQRSRDAYRQMYARLGIRT